MLKHKWDINFYSILNLLIKNTNESSMLWHNFTQIYHYHRINDTPISKLHLNLSKTAMEIIWIDSSFDIYQNKREKLSLLYFFFLPFAKFSSDSNSFSSSIPNKGIISWSLLVRFRSYPTQWKWVIPICWKWSSYLLIWGPFWFIRFEIFLYFSSKFWLIISFLIFDKQ